MGGVVGGMHAVVTRIRRKFQAFWRAGLDAEPASFALFDVDNDIATRLTGHRIAFPDLPFRLADTVYLDTAV